MYRALKTLLLWLLLLAVPVQGIAAATLSCRANHGPAMAVAEHHQGEHAGHAHHRPAELAQGGHHDHGKHATSTSCSACSACCIGAVPLPAELNWTAVRRSSEPVLLAPAPLIAGHMRSGIERPPRLLSA
jgi:hypothetical protein